MAIFSLQYFLSPSKNFIKIFNFPIGKELYSNESILKFNILSDLCFPSSRDGKKSTCNVGKLGSIHRSGISLGGGHDNPLHYSCLENPHRWRRLVGYSPWVHKELDTTEQLNTAHVYIFYLGYYL